MKISRKIIVVMLGLSVLCFSMAAIADGMENSGNSYTRSRMGATSKSKFKTNNAHSLSEFELAKYQYCGQDSDCVIATNGCCDCVNGSPEVAINKDRVQAFESRFKCLSVSCGTIDANPHCGNGVVSCVSHRCQYFDDRK